MATAPIPAQVPDLPIFSTQNYTQTAGVKLLVYSRPHKGKTEAILTLPRPLVLAAEHGLLTLEKHNIPYTPLTTVKEVRDCIAWLKAKKYVGVYDSIALDSATFLTTIMLAEFRNNPVLYTNNGQKHYGLLKEIVTDLLQELFAANVHVYVTAWEAEQFDVFGTMTGVYPATEGKALQSYLVHYFDLTAHLDWHKMTVTNPDGTTHQVEMPYLQTVEANGKFARSRKKGLAPFEDVNLTNLINKLATLA